ncbi:cytochrome c maturation protein CcmE [Chloroflexota bacterium]
MTEGGENMKIVYRGARPSGFKVDSNILVEGKYDSEGIFRASQIIMKCPSKYELED